MFDLEQGTEIWDTIRANKLRTVLTAFAVAWGILMLVLLLGSGNGLSHGVEYLFRDEAFNSVFVASGQTSMPYRGIQPGRSIQFTNRDYEETRGRIAGVDRITSSFGIKGSVLVAHHGESGSYEVRAVHPDHGFIERTIMIRGRFLNPIDQRESRKVAVLGHRVAEQLFGGGEPIGEWIAINGIAFRVVGIFTDDGWEAELEKLYIPISTAQRTFNGRERIDALIFTTGEAALSENERIVGDVRALLSDRHTISPEDEKAFFIWNTLEEFAAYQSLLGGIRIFIWVVGIGTLLVGVVGVSNIMMISVRERTREIGIRKAVGGTPGSIIGLVLLEAILITTVAGYVGLVLGVALTEILANAVPSGDYFREPQVDLRVALWATLLLVVAGAVAGYFPARRAAMIRPVEALRDE